jgi:hypothetical protein
MHDLPENTKLQYQKTERVGGKLAHTYSCVCGESKTIRADQRSSAMDCGCGASMVGKKFFRLTVTGRGHKYLWKFLCQCGQTVDSYIATVKSGHTKSCGCLNREENLFSPNSVSKNLTHGKSKTRTYKIWAGILSRTSNPASRAYPSYGGAGIGVCESWRVFETFYEDMGDCPDGLTIERIDNKKGYSKGNCRWATVKEQCLNRTSNRLVQYKGQTKPLKAWCDDLGLRYDKTRMRLDKLGWPVDKAFTK